MALAASPRDDMEYDLPEAEERPRRSSVGSYSAFDISVMGGGGGDGGDGGNRSNSSSVSLHNSTSRPLLATRRSLNNSLNGTVTPSNSAGHDQKTGISPRVSSGHSITSESVSGKDGAAAQPRVVPKPPAMTVPVSEMNSLGSLDLVTAVLGAATPKSPGRRLQSIDSQNRVVFRPRLRRANQRSAPPQRRGSGDGSVQYSFLDGIMESPSKGGTASGSRPVSGALGNSLSVSATPSASGLNGSFAYDTDVLGVQKVEGAPKSSPAGSPGAKAPNPPASQPKMAPQLSSGALAQKRSTSAIPSASVTSNIKLGASMSSNKKLDLTSMTSNSFLPTLREAAKGVSTGAATPAVGALKPTAREPAESKSDSSGDDGAAGGGLQRKNDLGANDWARCSFFTARFERSATLDLSSANAVGIDPKKSISAAAGFAAAMRPSIAPAAHQQPRPSLSLSNGYANAMRPSVAPGTGVSAAKIQELVKSLSPSKQTISDSSGSSSGSSSSSSSSSSSDSDDEDGADGDDTEENSDKAAGASRAGAQQAAPRGQYRLPHPPSPSQDTDQSVSQPFTRNAVYDAMVAAEKRQKSGGDFVPPPKRHIYRCPWPQPDIYGPPLTFRPNGHLYAGSSSGWERSHSHILRNARVVRSPPWEALGGE